MTLKSPRKLLLLLIMHLQQASRFIVCITMAAMLLAPLSSAFAQGEAADPDDGIFLDIGSAGVRRIKIAFPIVKAGSTSKGKKPEIDAAIASEFGRLFDFTMAFDVVPEASFPDSAEAFEVPLPVSRWKALGVELLIHGVVEQDAPGTRTVEFRLYNSSKAERILGKKFSKVSDADMSTVVKRFADLAIKELTGQMGIFSTKIAFAASTQKGKSKEIYIADFDGRNIVQVTNNAVPHMSPSWSPDGSKLTYTSFKNGRAQIFLYNLVTKKNYALSRGEGNTSGADWHPDGKTIAFSRSGQGKTSIYTMRSFDGSGEQRLIHGSGLEVEPAYSPDGLMIAFASGRFGNPHIFVRNLKTEQDTRITFAGWYNSSPSWRPDGKKLVFAGYDRDIDRYDLFQVNPDGRQLERLTLNRGDNENPSFSPDGRFIAFQSNRSPNGPGKQPGYKLHVMTKDGAGQRVIELPLGDVTMPTWSPYLVGL